MLHLCNAAADAAHLAIHYRKADRKEISPDAGVLLRRPGVGGRIRPARLGGRGRLHRRSAPRGRRRQPERRPHAAWPMMRGHLTARTVEQLDADLRNELPRNAVSDSSEWWLEYRNPFNSNWAR